MIVLPLLVAMLTGPAVAAAQPRQDEGVYIRLGVGPGFTTATLPSDAVDNDSTALSIATQLSIGWPIRPGLVVGVGTFPMVAPSPDYEGVDAGGQHVSATGPFVDYYPHPRRPVHLQAGALFAIGYLDGGDRESQLGAGYAITGGAGYDVPVSDWLSVGGIARITVYHVFGVDDTMVLASPALLVVVTAH